MTWLCRFCNSTTAWWEPRCSSCGRAKSYAEEPQRPHESEAEQEDFSLVDVVKQVFESPPPAPPIPTPGFLSRDCGCPPLYVCNNSACPRAPRVSLG